MIYLDSNEYLWVNEDLLVIHRVKMKFFFLVFIEKLFVKLNRQNYVETCMRVQLQ